MMGASRLIKNKQSLVCSTSTVSRILTVVVFLLVLTNLPDQRNRRCCQRNALHSRRKLSSKSFNYWIVVNYGSRAARVRKLLSQSTRLLGVATHQLLKIGSLQSAFPVKSVARARHVEHEAGLRSEIPSSTCVIY